mgnify:FL=1
MIPTSPRQVRVRFAPSPTGFLHIGGVRTALYNWLYARHHGGKFILRIEDTDLERSEQKYTDDILASMKWLGLSWDEEPLYQSKRLEIYREKAEELVAHGHAYRCTCTEADVEKMREVAMKEGKKPQYNRHCRDRKDVSRETPHVIRLKIPLEGHIEFNDLIRGVIRFENVDIDDFVLIRSNGAPTYNLSVVVDDVHSQMTHIVRGDDHINNTPKQLHLYRYLKYPLPDFAHLPMILGADKKKLSKRHGAVSANAYRADGYLPEALLNFLARLGWSHGDQEVFTIEEMIKYFSFDHAQKSSAVFNTEKLLWLNGTHIRSVKSDRILAIVADDYSTHFVENSLARAKTQLGSQLVALIQPKVKLLKEIAEQLVPLCTPGTVEVDSTGLKWGKDGSLKTVLKAAVQSALHLFEEKMKGASAPERTGMEQAWGTSPSLADAGVGHTEVEAMLRQVCDQNGVKLGDLAQPMRLAVTGRFISAGLFELIALLPWDVVSPRLKKVQEL